MTPGWPPLISPRTEVALVFFCTLLALLLRSVYHWYAPRGWREDELSNALVVSQHVLDGEVRLYYDDASGHEGLYHWLQAGTMAVSGPGVWGIRGVSILLGTLSVTLTYLLTRHLFDWPTATIAALALTVSFWSLMYSRSGQRHISVLVTTLASFYFLWKAMPAPDDHVPFDLRTRAPQFALAGVCMGIGFYTYFASRGVPLILVAWGLYLFVWRRDLWHTAWRGILLTLVVAAIFAAPLVVTLQRRPEAEARVSELAKPVYDARQGDFSTLGRYALITLSMFTHDGDDEALYNVPHRPVFGFMGGILFWSGIILALIRALGRARDPRHAFLLLWLGAGLAPGVLSIPAASLGHTILAQPVTTILPSLILTGAGRWLAFVDVSAQTRGQPSLRMPTAAVLVAALVFLVWEGVRGIYDYWFIWPEDAFNRVLHHSDLHEAAVWLNAHTSNRNVAIGGFLHERWDQQVMQIDLRGEGWQIRAFDPRSTYLLFPEGGTAILPDYLREGWGAEHLGTVIPNEASYVLRHVDRSSTLQINGELASFKNGLILVSVDVGNVGEGASELAVVTTWRVEQPLDLPPSPLLSKPPAPDEDATPHLLIFIQLLDENGRRVAGADSLGVDPYTLMTGDVFVQRLTIPLGGLLPGSYRLMIGLYNPATDIRWVDEMTGQDMVEWGIWQGP